MRLGVVVSFAHLYLLQWITGSVDWLIDREFNIRNVHSNLLTYWAIVGAYMAVGYYRRAKQRELLASRLETQLVESQLQILKMQLQPHFLSRIFRLGVSRSGTRARAEDSRCV